MENKGECHRSGGTVELVMASIERVKQPSDFPDYKLTPSHEGSIPSTLVACCSFLSIFCHEMVKPRRDPAMFKSWSLWTEHLFTLSRTEGKD